MTIQPTSLPISVSFSGIEMPKDILISIFRVVLKQHVNLQLSNVRGYFLISKKVNVLFHQARKQLFVEILLQIPEAKKIVEKTNSLETKVFLLKKWVTQTLPEFNNGTVFQKYVNKAITDEKEVLTLELLLKSGISPNSVNNRGISPLNTVLSYVSEAHLDKKKQIVKIVSLLLQHGINANGTEKKSSLLSILQVVGSDEVFCAYQIALLQMLVKHGANPTIKYKTNLSRNTISAIERAKQHNPYALYLFNSWNHKGKQ